MWYTGNYGIQIQLTKTQARMMSHSGRCDEDVAAGRLCAAIKKQLDRIEPETLVKELREYGAWSAEELADHDANLTRILWLAAGDIVENSL